MGRLNDLIPCSERYEAYSKSSIQSPVRNMRSKALQHTISKHHDSVHADGNSVMRAATLHNAVLQVQACQVMVSTSTLADAINVNK